MVLCPQSCQHLPYSKWIKILDMFSSCSIINTSPAVIYGANNLKTDFLVLQHCSQKEFTLIVDSVLNGLKALQRAKR